MRFSIKSKIIFGIFTGLIIFIIFVNGSIQSLLGDITKRKQITSIETSLTAYKRFERRNLQILSYEAYLIAQTPHLKATLNIPDVDKDSIIYALSEIDTSDIENSLLLILNSEGELLLNSNNHSQKSIDVKGMPGIEKALNGEAYSGYWKYEDNYYSVSLSPSLIANQLLGIIVVGLKINDKLTLKMMKESSGSNVTLHLGSNFFGSSDKSSFMDINIANYLLSKIEKKHTHKNSIGEHSIIGIPLHDTTYFASLVPIGETDAKYIIYSVENDYYEGFKSINRMLFLGSAIAIIFGILFSFYISKKISSPLLLLIKATKSYAQGDFSIRTEPKGNDEISDLTIAINNMANDLQIGRKNLMDKDAAEKEMRHMAYFDALTGLPNRRFFHEKLDEIIEENNHKNTMFAVFFIDIDNFKRINDSLGHDLGDDLLVMFSARLNGCIRETDILTVSGNEQKDLLVSRLGGDEFTIILNNLQDKKSVYRVADRIIHTYIKPFLLGDQEIVVTGSVGISISDMEDLSSEKMVKCADLAMYEAKHSGKNNYRIYTSDTQNYSAENLGLEIEMRRAIDNDEFDVYFQPIVDINSRKTIGTEVLARWNHPVLGIVPPDQFISVAENIGLISQLGDIILNKACKQFKHWQDYGFSLEKFNVNFSALQFYQPDLFEKVAHILTVYNISPKYLVVEITESLSMSPDQEVIDTLNNFKSIGIQIAIDDFGTGQSNLRYLSSLPLDVIKIDRCFISTICEDQFNSGIVRTILALAESLNLDVVAEGVETEEQLNLLLSLGLVHAQGYYFSKPLSVMDFEALMTAEETTHHLKLHN